MIRILCLNPTIDRMYYIDGFSAGKQYHGNSPDIYPSGKGINIARVLSYFQVKAIVYAFVGGLTGKKIEDEVLRLGHDGIFFHHQGETRSTINIMDLNNKKETEITESGVKITKEQENEFLSKLESDLVKGDLVICSGLPANGMDFDIYKKVSNICKDHGVNCALDANREYLLNSFPGKYSFVKPNENELKSLFNIQKELSNSDIIDCGNKLISMGVDTVLVSMGGKGAIAISKENVYQLTVPNVTIVSTIGSGDSTVAGFCYGMMQNKTIIESLKLSMAFGVVNAMHAEVGYVSPSEVDRIINGIMIQELK